MLLLLIQCKLAQCHPADIDESDGQTGLPFGAALARAHWGIALGVYELACAAPPRVALWGPLGQFLHVIDTNLALVVLGRPLTAPLELAAL